MLTNDNSNDELQRKDRDDTKYFEPGDDDQSLTACGLGSWRPNWIQVLASPVVFMINFSLIGIIQGMSSTYFVGAISTLEKRFSFDSKISGIISTADNVAELILSPLVAYLASRYNRPRMIGTGEIMISISCLISALPYMIYGPATHLLHNNTLGPKLFPNESRYDLCPANESSVDCIDGTHTTVWPAVLCLLIGNFIRGLGFTTYYIVGLPYVDDGVSKNHSPIYISITTALRLIGPALGFLLSSLSLRYYENPFYNPGISRRDPRFIGAWWIGFIVIGITLFLASIPMFLFPKQLQSSNIKAKDLKDNVKGLKESFGVFKRVMKNPIIVFHLIAITIRYIGISGYFLFKTKYVESQYRQSSSGASFITGSTSIAPMSVGIIFGGIVITYFKPKPRKLVIYMFLVEMFSNATMFYAMFLGCPVLKLNQYIDNNNQFSLTSMCNQQCKCTTSIFTPVCSSDKSTTYFSPCFAGCKELNGNTNTLSQCSCIEDNNGYASYGYCESDAQNCDKLFAYLSVITVGKFVSSTATTGSYLLTLRSVDPKDKSVVIGVMTTFVALFAFIPYPLIFGAITDSACLVWERICGKTGNCWLYDQDKFRYYLHGSAFAFMTFGSMFELGIVFMSNRIKEFF